MIDERAWLARVECGRSVRMSRHTIAGGNAARWAPLALIAIVSLLFGGAYLLSDAVNTEVHRATSVLSDGDLQGVRDYIRSFGVWARAVSLLLMVFQAVVAPIPSFAVIFANGLAFGIAWGWAISVVGQVLAATVCFWLARGFGRGPVTAVVGRFGLESADRWFGRWGRTPCSLPGSCPVWRSIPFHTRPV